MALLNPVQTLLNLARAEIGTVESPPNSNKQKYGAAYGWNGVAWCAIFVWWLFHMAGLEKLLPKKTASCAVLIASAKREGLWVTSDYRPGDILVYNFGTAKNPQRHTGILESISGSVLTAIEGNTAIGNDDNGGRVMRRTRKVSQVEGALRPRYETVEPQKHIALIAQECADGKGGWGTGAMRKAKLKEAGYDAAQVQLLINALLIDGIRAVVTGSTLNLRREATTEKQNIIRSFPKGTALCIVEIKEGTGATAWGRVTHEWGTDKRYSGWVSMDWVSLE